MLTSVLSPTLSLAGLHFPTPAVSPSPATCVMLQHWSLPGDRMSPSLAGASWGIIETNTWKESNTLNVLGGSLGSEDSTWLSVVSPLP